MISTLDNSSTDADNNNGIDKVNVAKCLAIENCMDEKNT